MAVVSHFNVDGVQIDVAPATPPTVGNGTLTIQKNGTNVQTFTANQTTNATANITVPTKTSELTNDSGYTTNTGTVTQVKVGSTAYDPSSGVVSLPAYPTVNNATLTIQKNGANVQTFTANQSSNATANISVPTKTSELTNDSGYTTNTGTVTQVKVGTTAYNPSSGVVSLPAYPTVNNATLTIQKNGTNVQTFTANASANKTANITVPTKTSELTNDSGYTTNTGTVTQVKVGSTAYNPSSGVVSLPAYPTKTSELTNDSGYTTNTGTVTQVKVGTTAYDPSSGVVSLPAYPTVNNATLTIQKNGTNVQTFTANASANKTANITVPTKVSELTNDSGYTTNTGTVTQVKVGSTAYNPSSGVVSLPAYPTDTNNRRVFYGTCSTAAATAAKVIALSDTTGWELKAGTTVVVRFTNTNTASKVTLNVNSSGAKSIYYNNAVYTGSSSTACGYAKRTHVYTYDGTYWVWVAHGFDDNTSYSSKAAASGGTDVSLVTTGEKYTWNNKGTGTVTQVKVGTTAYNPSSGVVSLPAYPTVNNATLTIQKNGTNVQTFTANQSSNVTANITVPTVNNTLTSTSTSEALSANQGRALSVNHNALVTDLANGTNKPLYAKSIWDGSTDANAYGTYIYRAHNVTLMATNPNNAGIYLYDDAGLGIRNKAATAWTPVYASNFVNSSSKTKKHDINAMNETMGDKIMELTPVSFIYNDDETNKTQYGLIAEDVVNIYPSVIVNMPDGSMGIDYSKLIPFLIKEIQNLKNEIRERG